MFLVSIPVNPMPEGGVVGTFKTPDGAEIRFARWMPTTGRKGTVCLLQGRAEFIEKYYEVVSDLRSRGFAVACLDWRGQGMSHRALADPRKGHVRRFSDYDRDLETFIKEVVLPDCPPPYFALAHSMGGAILLRACHEGRRWFDRLVMSAPMIGLPRHSLLRIAPFALRTLNVLGRGTAYIPVRGPDPTPTRHNFLGNTLTSDPVRYARNVAVIEAEPLLALGRPTIAWADAAMRAMKRFESPSFPASLRQPVLLVAAGSDEVVSTPAIESFASNLLAGAHIILPGSKHEILQEQDQYRAQFWAAFDAFVPGTPMY